MAFTEQQLKRLDHIPLSEIERDIVDTQAEIDQYERELVANSGDPVKNRLPIYMAEGNIAQRRTLLDTMTQLKAYREK